MPGTFQEYVVTDGKRSSFQVYLVVNLRIETCLADEHVLPVQADTALGFLKAFRTRKLVRSCVAV